MKNLLKLEEAAQFLACAFALYLIDLPWWTYMLLLLGPDFGMLGYLINTRVGAISYNLLHHKGVAMILLMVGALFISEALGHGDAIFFAGIILYGHASMDRIFGYGLKFGDSFQHTHLGWIGKLKGQKQV